MRQSPTDSVWQRLTVEQVLKNGEKPALQLCAEYELSEFSRFTRENYANFMTMISKTVAERTSPGQRQSVEEQGEISPILSFETKKACGALQLTREFANH